MEISVIGGGAAGFFAAISAAESMPAATVSILERSAKLLCKVKISGGGRCNVTHACFEPRDLVKNYPRGEKALLSPFTRFQPRDTVKWFKERGVILKVEEDGRMFPTTDSSQTIIDCLMEAARKAGVQIKTHQRIETVKKTEKSFQLTYVDGEIKDTDILILATGSNPIGHAWAESLGHSIESLVPSLFTFNIPDSPLLDLSGIVVNDVSLRLSGSKLMQRGPLLLTHWGFSGPAALKLSAWGARFLHEKDYHNQLIINWLPELTSNESFDIVLRKKNSTITLANDNPFSLPKKLWYRLIEICKIDPKLSYRDISDKALRRLSELLQADIYKIEGKTTNKQEFVTCGGIKLNEVNFKTMESRICSGLFFAGEVLDIDGVTGGFNFQNAWTTGWIAGKSLVSCPKSS